MGVLDQLPHTCRYVESLPEGLASYPELRVKGSVPRIALLDPPPGFVSERLPPEVGSMLDNPPLVSDWVPEVHVVALSNALLDLSFASEAELFQWIEIRLEQLTTGRMYRALASMASPHQLVRMASRAYKKFRQGSSRTVVEKADNYNIGLIEYPDCAFNPLYMEFIGISLLGPYRLSRAKNPGWKVLEYTPTASKLQMIYDVDQAH